MKEKCNSGVFLSNSGFTLIELLVVVLIISILAAVAVPQYKRAVRKANMQDMIVFIETLAQDFELYYLNQGSYPPNDDWNTFSAASTFTYRKNALSSWFGKYPTDMYIGNQRNLSIMYKDFTNGYNRWLQHSARPNQRECLAQPGNQSAAEVCKSLGGKYANRQATPLGRTFDVYELR